MKRTTKKSPTQMIMMMKRKKKTEKTLRIEARIILMASEFVLLFF
jgi:hypothetical protein